MGRAEHELASRMVERLRAAGAITDAQLAVAARRFEEGAFPSTALRDAGVEHALVLHALAAASGLPPAPPPTHWVSKALHLSSVNATSWSRARAVPVGGTPERLQVAFVDPALAQSARVSLPPHEAFVCLEEDYRRAMEALLGGATLTPEPRATTVADPAALEPTEAFAPGAVPQAADSAGPSVPRASAPRAGVAPAAHGGAVPLGPERLGPWLIDGELARGGMGVVYRAHDERGRRAALKVVHQHLMHDEEVRERFLREARATQRLQHRNIVGVLDVGEAEPSYLAVEFVDGGTVLQLLRRQGRLPLLAALELILQLFEGLQAAHGQHIVHRDLKPSNLLLSRDGTLKIADFGVARELDRTALTQTGSTLGTPAYMSPEQVRAEPIDGRSDVYAAGVILYELLAGRKPFEADSVGAVVAAVLAGRATPLFELDPSVPEAVDDLVAMLMHPDVRGRPQDAGTVIDWLRPVVEEGRKRHPQVLAELLRDPGAAATLRREQADALLQSAKTLLQSGPAGRDAAALQLYRARALVPEHEEAGRLLDGLAESQGLAFGPTKNAKLVEVERELAARPDDPVLLQRAGQLSRQEGNVYRAALYWRRYLRVRPEDAYVQGQLARLLAPPADATVKLATVQLLAPAPLAPPAASASAPGTVERIAGHIATGGFVKQAPIAPPAPQQIRVIAAPAPPEEVHAPAGEQLRAFWSLHGGKLILLVVGALALVLVLRGVRGFISSSQENIDQQWRGAAANARPKDRAEEQASRQDFALATTAAKAGDWATAEARSSAVIRRGADDQVLAAAHVMRGRALLEQGKALAAVADFSRVIDAFRNDDVAFPEALLRRGVAQVRAGDGDSALRDLDACIATRTGHPVVYAEARVERALLREKAGDLKGAQADLQWATTYAPNSAPIARRARDERARLGGGEEP
ncbi:MAG: protein kinase [Deltaproteobacteria bacterium]|nr:protein kinase [Deltaproteobacteria bacterium]